MNNSEQSAETAAQQSGAAEVTPSSQTIANAPVGGSLELECPGAGIIRIGTSPHCRTGGRVGFDFSVSWGQYGFLGGVLPRREAEKLMLMIYEQLKDIKETEEEEYQRRTIEMRQYFESLK